MNPSGTEILKPRSAREGGTVHVDMAIGSLIVALALSDDMMHLLGPD
jgi:hypothetical protein